MGPMSPDDASGPRLFESLGRREPASPLHALTLQLAVAIHALALGIVFVRGWLEVPVIHEPGVEIKFATITPPLPPPEPVPEETRKSGATPTPPAATRASAPETHQRTAPPQENLQPDQLPIRVDNEPVAIPDTTGGGGKDKGPPGPPIDDGLNVAKLTQYRIGGPATRPVLIRRVEPVYAQLAQTARYQGVVLLEALIRKDGSVGDIRPLRTLSMGLTEAAIEAVHQWRYKPGELNGVPVDFFLEVKVHFGF